MTTDNCLIKIKQKYFLWSEYLKCPITCGYNEDKIKEIIDKHQYSKKWINDQIEQCNLTRCGNKYKTIEEILKDNCAGIDEEYLSENEIYELYYVKKYRPVIKKCKSVKE